MDQSIIQLIKDLDPMARINFKMMCLSGAKTKQGKEYLLMLNVHQRMAMRVIVKSF